MKKVVHLNTTCIVLHRSVTGPDPCHAVGHGCGSHPEPNVSECVDLHHAHSASVLHCMDHLPKGSVVSVISTSFSWFHSRCKFVHWELHVVDVLHKASMLLLALLSLRPGRWDKCVWFLLSHASSSFDDINSCVSSSRQALDTCRRERSLKWGLEAGQELRERLLHSKLVSSSLH